MTATPSTADEASGPTLLLPFALGHFANDLAPIAMFLVIPAYGVATGLSPVEIGLLFTLHGVGAALAFLPAGILADHAARPGRLLAATFFWVGLGYFAASLADGFWAFALLIALANAGDAAWHPMATGILARRHPRRRAHALGMHAVGGYVAEVGGLVLVGFLLSWTDWRVTTQLIVLPGLAMGVVFLVLAGRVPPAPRGEAPGRDLVAALRGWATRAGGRIVALFTLYNMALFAVVTMTPVFLHSAHGFGWRETALALAAMTGPGAVAQPFIGRLSDATGRRALIAGANAVAALAALVAWQASAAWLVLVALGVLMSLLLAVRPVVLALAVDHAGRREGTGLGLAFLFMDGVAASAAVMAGFVAESDVSNAFLLAAGFALLAFALAPFARPGTDSDGRA